MSAADLSRFEELLSRYLDDELTPADTAELVALLTEPPRAARFVEIMRLNSDIGGLLAAPVPDATMMGLVQSDIEESLARPRPARRVSFRALAWAAGFVVLAALAGVFLFNRTPSFESPVVASVQGEVRSLGASGEYVLASGQSWRSGETLKTLGSNSAVTLSFRDGSHLDFGGDTVAGNESGQDGWRVRLDQGRVRATLQPTRRPCVFATPNAEAIGAGTKLQLLVSGHATRLEVSAGDVRFRRRHDGAEVRVRASQYAVVAPNVPFAATPFHPDPHHPQINQMP